jgi:23S rRNA pseudouridine955/2504/2580 synthase
MKNMNREWHRYTAAEDDNQRRFDRIIRKMFPQMKLGHIYKIIRQGEAKLNGRRVKPSTKISAGDEISVMSFDDSREAHRSPSDEASAKSAASAIDPMIVFENTHVLALNKPRGLLVHGPESLDTAVQRYLAPTLPDSLSFNPGPLHRLDRNTSGLILFAKTLKGAQTVTRLLQSGRMQKYYIGILDGEIDRKETWKDSLVRNGVDKKTLPELERDDKTRLAVTEVFPVMTAAHVSLALLRIRTGRTHQIRAQAALHAHALSGDSKYGGSSFLPRYLLHAAAIGIKSNTSLIERRVLGAVIPGEAKTIIQTLFGDEAPGAIEGQLEKLGVSIRLT